MDDVLLVSNDKSNFPTQEEMALFQRVGSNDIIQ